ncbi:Glycerol-3-phosphate acyltransferase 1, mitochondrial [Frankliniella fusca]|uniref:Glycerol-3-phosphate acyltransferase 1, mitochondrial n=1 Tax=Frankliniella fusca TaxID=407009 RepID=A0AAE1H5Y6_9NEOP|nr:Glycerol-3-phosphate acyltransferase 1, mitochondrial [Frankliniella fusca]
MFECFVWFCFESLHKDKYGKPKKLSSSQLETVRRWGEFEVESLNFPGQVHKWQLSQFLQKGTERSRESLLNDLALALRFLLVTARARFTSHFFSVSESLQSFLTGLLRLLDIVIGIPSLQAHNLDAKIREERCRYLVAELPEFEDTLEVFCNFVRRQIKRATMEKFELEKESCHPPVPVPYQFLTPKGIELDLRLFSRDIMKRALPVLVNILERETRGWFLHFRERLIAELRTRKLPDDEIEKEVNQAVMREYLQRVYTSILTHPEILALGEGIAQLLVQQAQSVVLMHRAVENVQNKLSKTKENLKQRMELSHPVLSRIEPWMREKLRNAEGRFIDDCQWSAHEEALTLCTAQHLHQTVYFLNRDLTFMREREPVLTKELRKVKTPTRTFQWLTRIWLPTHWVIRRNFQGQSDIIPTVLSNQATSITTPRSDPSQPVFLVEKEEARTTTTRWPMWRWINYCHRTWSWTWNAMFFFGVVLPWCSPLSLRALFCAEPFMPDLELSQVNGTLFPRKSSLTPTLCSRMLVLWRHISKSRTHFETKPDTGFIGKGFVRHVNRFWNYIIKGVMGTLAIGILFPALCLAVSFSSIAIALTAILWMPCFTLILHVLMILFYDVDSPDASRNRWCMILEAVVWNIIMQGLLQPVAALLVAVFVCPLISFCIVSVGVCRYGMRLVWDSLVFHLLIKKRGRIPACDSLVVKRIAGPGLASNYYYQIRPEQALAAFEAKMELDELSAYQHQIEQTILQPQRDYSQFVEACFGPFSAQLSVKADPYRELEKEAADLINCLHEKLERRRRVLQTGLASGVRSKVKLTTMELKMSIQQAALLLEKFYPSHVLRNLPVLEEDFWENKGLVPHDWAGLAGLMYADVFSLDFLTPLDEGDTKFRLEPHPQVDLSRYTEMLQSTELLTSRPDLLGPVYSPRANLQIQSPFLDVSVFNPRRVMGVKHDRRTEGSGIMGSRVRMRKMAESPAQSCAIAAPSTVTITEAHTEHKNCSLVVWRPWKRQCIPYSAEKLLIPLPIPHPAHIAVTIHNRDTEDPIPLDSELCQEILRAVEDAYGMKCMVADPDSHNVGSRYRAGPGDSSFDSAASRSSLSSDCSRPAIGDVLSDERSGTSIITFRRDTLVAPCQENEQRVERRETEREGSTSGASRGGEGSDNFNWRPTDWAGVMRRKRKNSGSVRVDLASPEDVTLDADGSCVVFSSYGTTV